MSNEWAVAIPRGSRWGTEPLTTGGMPWSLITSITWSMIPSNSPTFLQSTFGGLFCYKAAGRDRLPVPQRLRQLDGLVGFIPTPSPRLDSNFPIGQEWKVPCLS